MLEQKFVSVAFGHVVEIDDLVSESRPVRYEDFQRSFLLSRILACQLLIGTEPGLGFGLTGFRSHSDPFQFPLQSLAPFAFLLFLHLQPPGLLVKP